MRLENVQLQSSKEASHHHTTLSLSLPSTAVLRLMLLAMLLVTVQCDLTVIQTNTLQANCTSSPYSTLNLCNNSCFTCLSTNSTICTQCNDNYYDYSLDNGCTLKSNPYIYYGFRLLVTPPYKITDIQKFGYSSADQKFTYNNTVDICMKDTFNYQMLGLFKLSDTVVTTYVFAESITSISIKFNYMTLLVNTKLKVVLVYNSKTRTNTVSSKSKTLDGTYFNSTDSKTPNILSLPSLTIANPRSIIELYQDQFGGFDPSDTISIQISCSSSAQTGAVFWGFSDLTVAAGECTSCIKKPLQRTLDRVSQVTLYLFAVVAIVGTLFVLYVSCISSYVREKLNRKYSDGENTSRIPFKVLDRLIDNLNPVKHLKPGRPQFSRLVRLVSQSQKLKKSSRDQ